MEIKFLAKALGGSHSYGLSTPTSDKDFRGIVVHTDAAHLVGLEKGEKGEKGEMLVCQNSLKDEAYTEFRHALKLLRGANTQMIELLYNEVWELVTPTWNAVVENRQFLVDSTKLFSCLRGYMQGELRLANGERTGKLGGKRKEAIDKFGYSPKNFVQLLRLAKAGSVYFQKGFFPVNMMSYDVKFCQYLLDIKTHPESYSREELNEEALKADTTLIKDFENRAYNTVFREDVANQLCLDVYRPLINQI